VVIKLNEPPNSTPIFCKFRHLNFKSQIGEHMLVGKIYLYFYK